MGVVELNSCCALLAESWNRTHYLTQVQDLHVRRACIPLQGQHLAVLVLAVTAPDVIDAAHVFTDAAIFIISFLKGIASRQAFERQG